MSRTTWNTYRTTGYTCDVANDQRSAGGVHLHQVRHHRSGGWQHRILQSNGHEAPGPVSPLEDRDGEAHYATAAQGGY